MNEVKFNPKEHMIDLKGKQYLPVAWRLVWFQQEHSDWGITTEMMHFDPEAKYAIFRATVCDADGVPKASAYGSESAKDFSDYLEKARNLLEEHSPCWVTARSLPRSLMRDSALPTRLCSLRASRRADLFARTAVQLW